MYSVKNITCLTKYCTKLVLFAIYAFIWGKIIRTINKKIHAGLGNMIKSVNLKTFAKFYIFRMNISLSIFVN